MKRHEYTKAEVDKIIARLLVDDKELKKWTSMKGVPQRKREVINFNLTLDELWAIRYLAREQRMTVRNMLRWLIIGHFIRKNQDIVLECTEEVGEEIMVKLFGVAGRKVQAKSPKDAIILYRSAWRDNRPTYKRRVKKK